LAANMNIAINISFCAICAGQECMVADVVKFPATGAGVDFR
jgi:hypothetical protein